MSIKTENWGMEKKHFDALVEAAACPHNVLTGVETVGLGPGRAVVRLEISEKNLNPYEMAHGAVFCTLIDTAMGAVLRTLHIFAVTVELQTGYVREARVGDVLTASGELISEGKTIVRARAEVKNQRGELVAYGHGSFYRKGVFAEG